MTIKITDYRIQQIIHNISEDFRFSSKHEKHAPFFYSVDGTHEIDKKSYEGIIDYITIAQKSIKKDIAWKEKLLDENSIREDQKLLEIMKIIEKEHEDLYNYLITLSHTF